MHRSVGWKPALETSTIPEDWRQGVLILSSLLLALAVGCDNTAGMQLGFGSRLGFQPWRGRRRLESAAGVQQSRPKGLIRTLPGNGSAANSPSTASPSVRWFALQSQDATAPEPGRSYRSPSTGWPPPAPGLSSLAAVPRPRKIRPHLTTGQHAEPHHQLVVFCGPNTAQPAATLPMMATTNMKASNHQGRPC